MTAQASIVIETVIFWLDVLAGAINKKEVKETNDYTTKRIGGEPRPPIQQYSTGHNNFCTNDPTWRC